MSQKRVRIVDGSCWPCRQRRVLCDLEKPTCRKCVKAGRECNFDARRLKWQDGLASRGHLVGKTLPVMDAKLKATKLTIAQRTSMYYFEHDFWPLLCVGTNVPPAPYLVVVESPPLLQAICALSATHQANLAGTEVQCGGARLSCIASLREHLAKGTTCMKASNAMMMTMIFLCIVDGYVAPQDEMAATTVHLQGARAIINTLGGARAVMNNAQSGELTLLSEFASMDLTRALLHGGMPFLPPTLWQRFEKERAWWGELGGPDSLAPIFGHFATMAICAYKAKTKGLAIDIETIERLQQELQPPVPDDTLAFSSMSVAQRRKAHGQSLCRAFRHCALLYLWRALCRLPIQHEYVQREVQACLKAIAVLLPEDKIQNCALFPLCVAGAHSIEPIHRNIVLKKLEDIEKDLRFGNVQCLRTSLRKLWLPGGQDKDWLECFEEFSQRLFIL